LTDARERAKRVLPKSDLCRDLARRKEIERDPLSEKEKRNLERIFIEVIEKYESDRLAREERR